MTKMSDPPLRTRKPAWLKKPLPSGPEYERMRQLVRQQGLATVCQQAQCPNQYECFGKGTATFMILGDKCSRNCRFCAVDHMPEGPPDPDEPERVADTIVSMGLRYAVITSVTRDDLEDGGAALFVQTIRAVKAHQSDILVEVLIPDLAGNWQALQQILAAEPDVLNHNVETVPRLYETVRPQAIYERSLELLRRCRQQAPHIPTKSGIMVGLGESREELAQTFVDLARAGVAIVTIGQYLQPTRNHLEVERFVHPDEFVALGELALQCGLKGVSAGPAVRSSFEAEKLYREVLG